MEVGKKMEHKLSKDWVLVLKIEGNEVICRTKLFELVRFFDFELQEITK